MLNIEGGSVEFLLDVAMVGSVLQSISRQDAESGTQAESRD